MHAPGGPAGLDGFELAALGDPATYFFNDLTQGDPEGDFHQRRVLDRAHQAEGFRALARRRAKLRVPVSAAHDDEGNVGPSFNIVDAGGLPPQAAFDREGRALARLGHAGL